jgi:hypothetical protein
VNYVDELGRAGVLIGATTAQIERHRDLREKFGMSIPRDAELVELDDFKPLPAGYKSELAVQGTLYPGAVLVLSPYNTGCYAPFDEAEFWFERENLQIVASLCKALGAKRIQTEMSSLNVERLETTMAANVRKMIGRVPAFKADASVSMTQKQEWNSKLKVGHTYPGSPPDFVEAKRLVEHHRLKDPAIVGLVELRDGLNGITSMNIAVSYDGTSDRNLKVAAGVTLPAASFGANFAQSRHTLRRVSLVMKIEF